MTHAQQMSTGETKELFWTAALDVQGLPHPVYVLDAFGYYNEAESNCHVLTAKLRGIKMKLHPLPTFPNYEDFVAEFDKRFKGSLEKINRSREVVPVQERESLQLGISLFEDNQMGQALQLFKDVAPDSSIGCYFAGLLLRNNWTKDFSKTSLKDKEEATLQQKLEGLLYIHRGISIVFHSLNQSKEQNTELEKGVSGSASSELLSSSSLNSSDADTDTDSSNVLTKALSTKSSCVCLLPLEAYQDMRIELGMLFHELSYYYRGVIPELMRNSLAKPNWKFKLKNSFSKGLTPKASFSNSTSSSKIEHIADDAPDPMIESTTTASQHLHSSPKPMESCLYYLGISSTLGDCDAINELAAFYTSSSQNTASFVKAFLTSQLSCPSRELSSVMPKSPSEGKTNKAIWKLLSTGNGRVLAAYWLRLLETKLKHLRTGGHSWAFKDEFVELFSK